MATMKIFGAISEKFKENIIRTEEITLSQNKIRN
jgi:hypothetical protein